jgi:hypothetical protein
MRGARRDANGLLYQMNAVFGVAKPSVDEPVDSLKRRPIS